MKIHSSGSMNSHRTLPSNCVDGHVPFGSLQDLEFEGFTHVFQSAFLGQGSLSFLTTLRLRLEPLNLVNINALVAAIVSSCPQLELLCIDREARTLYSEDRFPSVPWPSIRPLLSCKKIESLLFYCFRVSLSIDQLTELLISRPMWKTLVVYTEEPLHFSDILLFSKHCPQLRRLGVYIDTRLDLDPLRDTMSGIAFPCLDEIDFGSSLVNINDAHVHRINRSDTPLCPRCAERNETVVHLILHCPAHRIARGELRRRLPYY